MNLIYNVSYPLNRAGALMAVPAIVFYRKTISPHKGFRCAHAAVTGGESCSDAALRILKSHVLSEAIPQIHAQFDKCRESFLYFEDLISGADQHLADLIAQGNVSIKCCD